MIDVTLATPPDRDTWLKLRMRNLNSTEIPALFGLSPYETALEIALVKAGKIDAGFVENERSTWGTRLQNAIAYGVAEDYGLIVSEFTEYAESPSLRLGASFDFRICDLKPIITVDENELRDFFRALGPGILEIKNLDPLKFRSDWQIHEGQLEAAPHIELQLQHQMLMSRLKWGCICALVGGNKIKLLIRNYDPEVGLAILERSRQFWHDLDAGKFPPAKLPPDAGILKKLYNFAEPGSFLDGTDDERLATYCAEYIEASTRAKIAEDDKKTASANVLQIIQEHEKAVTKGYKISTWMVAPRHVEYEAEGYRNMKITKIKVKE